MKPSSIPVLQVEVQFAARSPWVPAAADLRRWARAAFAAAGGGDADVRPNTSVLCIRVVGNTAARSMNRRFRGIDRPTNVLSFPASDEERQFTGALGDLVVCAPIVDREARQQGKKTTAHWAHMVVHGVLHLLGYDHQDNREAQVMENLEVEILRGFGYQNPYESTDDPTE
jgi:probable rRNA maturation factor